jgi:hypothetical protein
MAHNYSDSRHVTRALSQLDVRPRPARNRAQTRLRASPLRILAARPHRGRTLAHRLRPEVEHGGARQVVGVRAEVCGVVPLDHRHARVVGDGDDADRDAGQ